MVPLPVVVLDILVDKLSEVSLSQRHDSAETFLFDGANEPLGIASQEATDREHAPAVGIVLVKAHGLLGKAAGVQPARLAQTQPGKLADRYSRVRTRRDGSVEELLGGSPSPARADLTARITKSSQRAAASDRSGRCAVAGDRGRQQEQGQVTADAPDALESLGSMIWFGPRVGSCTTTPSSSKPRPRRSAFAPTVLDQHDQGAVMSQMLCDECGISREGPGGPPAAFDGMNEIVDTDALRTVRGSVARNQQHGCLDDPNSGPPSRQRLRHTRPRLTGDADALES